MSCLRGSLRFESLRLREQLGLLPLCISCRPLRVLLPFFRPRARVLGAFQRLSFLMLPLALFEDLRETSKVILGAVSIVGWEGSGRSCCTRGRSY